MADFTKTVEIIFGGKDEVSPTIRSITKDLDTFSNSVQTAAAPFAKLADSILLTETAILSLGAALVGVAVDQSAKFSEAMNSIGIEFGGTRDQIDSFSTEVLAFSQSSGKSLEDITAAVNSAVDAGIAFNDSLKVLSSTEKLSTVAHSDFSDTTALVAKTLNVYGASVDEAAHVSEAFFTLTRTGVIEVEDLGDKFLKLATTTAQLGIPFDTLVAALATLTAHGVPATDAFKTLTSVISSIEKPTDTATRLANQLGIEFNATALKTQGLDGVLQSVATATGGNNDKMIALFGSLGAVKSAMILGTDSGVTFRDSLNDVANSAERLNQAFALVQDDLNRINQNIVNNVKAVLIGIGKPLLEEFGNAGLALADVFKGLKIGIDQGAFDSVLEVLNNFSKEAAAIFEQIAINLPDALGLVDFSPLTDSLQNLGDEMRNVFIDIFGEIDITTPEGLAEAIQKAVNILSTLTNITSGIVDSFRPIFQAIGELGNQTAQQGEETGILIGKYLGYAKALVDFGTVIGSIAILAKETGTNLKGFIEIIIGSVTVLVNGFQVAFDVVVLTITETLRQLSDAAANTLDIVGLDKLSSGFRTTALEMKSIGDGLQADITRNALESREGLNQIGQGFIDAVSTAESSSSGIVGSVSKIKESAESLSNGIYDLSRSITVAFDDTGSAVANVAAEFAKFDENGNIISTAKNGIELFGISSESVFGNLEENISAAGKSADGFVKTMENGVPTYSQVIDKVGAISQHFKTSGDIAEEAAKKTDQYQLKLLELASNERIKVIEATVTLNVAQLESQTKIATTILEGLSTTIQSSADLLGTLFGELNDSSSFHNLFLIERAIEKEMDIRTEATKKQNELIDAQIDMIRTQTEALSRGDSLITIQGDGLAPELEAFMMAVLERIQIRAAADRSLYLLGLPA